MDPTIEAAVAMALSVANRYDSDDFDPALIAELNSLSEKQLGPARKLLAEQLSEVTDPIGAGYLAVWLGGEVEEGSDPGETGWAVLQAMLRWTRTIVTVDDDSDVEEPEPDPSVIEGLQNFGRSVVAHLTRSQELCERLKSDRAKQEEIYRIDHLSYGCMWVAEILRHSSGEMTILHIESRKGVRIRYENFGNAFHFFTVLQSTLKGVIPGAKPASPNTLNAALGKTEVSQGLSDGSCWHYGQPTCNEPDLAASVWGEGTLDEIQIVDDTQVMLLWPPIVESRTWDGGFFGPIIHAALPQVEVVGTLSSEEVDHWFERLNLKSRKEAKSFWQFWK